MQVNETEVSREWALSDDGKKLIDLIQRTFPAISREDALRIAEESVVTEELYADPRQTE